MSLVTEVILIFNEDEERAATILERINTFFDDPGRHQGGFKTIVTDDAHQSEIGGSRAFTTDVVLGAFNYLPLEAFVAHIRHLVQEDVFTWPERLQIIYKEENDERFSIINNVED